MTPAPFKRLTVLGAGLMLLLAGCGVPGLDLQPLTVQVAGDGEGTVTSDPAGIEVSSGEVTAEFETAAVVTLTANPAEGSTFDGWSGACEGTDPVCEVTMDQARTVTATFSAVDGGPHTLTVSTDGDGDGAVTSDPAGIDTAAGETSADFAAGTDVTLTADASEGSTFAGWSGSCAGNDPECTVTMDQAHNVTATFTASGPNTLTVSTEGDGAGYVTSDPAGIDTEAGETSAEFAAGTEVTLTATATDGFFAGWQGACGHAESECVVTMDGDQTVTAVFTVEEPDNVTLTVDFTGEGEGSVTSTPAGIDCTQAEADCTATFANGTTVTLSAAEAAGSTFDGWSDNCTVVDGDCEITLDGDTTVAAAFATVDWESGNAMAFMIEGAGHDSVNVIAEAFEGGAAPVLVIEYNSTENLEVPVAAGEDDAEEWLTSINDGSDTYPANTVYTTSSDLELTYDDAGTYATNQLIGLRFANVTLPVDATIDNAYIRFTAASSTTGGQTLAIYGEADANPQSYPCEYDGTCSSDPAKVSERARTAASVNWTPTAQTSADTFVTENISTLVEEILGR